MTERGNCWIGAYLSLLNHPTQKLWSSMYAVRRLLLKVELTLELASKTLRSLVYRRSFEMNEKQFYMRLGFLCWMHERYTRTKEILLSFHDLYIWGARVTHHLLLVVVSACAWKSTNYALVKPYDMRAVCIKHYKHRSLRQLTYVTRNLSYLTGIICKSNIVVDLHDSLIKVGRLRRTRMLISW
jgi:hypothetical protein